MTSPTSTTSTTSTTQRPNGPIVGNADAPTTYYDLMGGQGSVALKRLLSGPQMSSTLDIAEHVVFLQGASCGLHQHTRTEEIYYVLGGDGVVDMDGEPLQVHGGDLVVTPLGSTHKVSARANTNLAILVVEVLPGPEGWRGDPTRVAMAELLSGQAACPADGVRVASVELAKHFTGTWGPFRVAALEPGARLGPCTIEGAEACLYLADGHARFEFGDRRQAGKAGLYVAVPSGTPWTIVNDSIHCRAEVVITQVGLP